MGASTSQDSSSFSAEEIKAFLENKFQGTSPKGAPITLTGSQLVDLALVVAKERLGGTPVVTKTALAGNQIVTTDGTGTLVTNTPSTSNGAQVSVTAGVAGFSNQQDTSTSASPSFTGTQTLNAVSGVAIYLIRSSGVDVARIRWTGSAFALEANDEKVGWIPAEVSMGTTSTKNLTVTGTVNASNSISTAANLTVSGSATVTGGVSAGSASVTGSVTAGSASVTGNVAAGSASVTGSVTAGSASVTGSTSTGSISINGGSSLSSYLQGQSWTPNISFGGSSTGVTGTMSGSYFRIGSNVICTYSIGLSNKGSHSTSAAAQITGLPYTVSSGSVTSVGAWGGLTFDSNYNAASISPDSSATTAHINQSTSNGSYNNLTWNNFANGTAIWGIIIYQTAASLEDVNPDANVIIHGMKASEWFSLPLQQRQAAEAKNNDVQPSLLGQIMGLVTPSSGRSTSDPTSVEAYMQRQKAALKA